MKPTRKAIDYVRAAHQDEMTEVACMRLVTFTESGRTRIGLLVDSGIVDLSQANPSLPTDMLSLLEEGSESLQAAGACQATSPHYEQKDVVLESPILRPPKILAVGLNYRDHVEEGGRDIPETPIIFNKQSTSANGPFTAIHNPVNDTTKLDYEGELALVIGKRCRRAPKEKAESVVAGYMVANDVSVRDWQYRAPTMMMGKSWDTHCPMGPALVTKDEVPDPHTLDLKTWVNDELRQNSNTKHLIFDCWTLIEHLSTAFTLEAGDVVLTGTCGGVGAWMDPQCWLKSGDTVRIAIGNLGEINNPIIDEPADTVRF